MATKALSAILLGLFLAPLTAWGGAQGVYQQADAKVVCLKTYTKDKMELVGTGFFLAPDVIGTVAHQVKGAERVVVILADGRSSEAEDLILARPEWDVALIRVPATKFSGLTIAPELPALGEEVFTIGCPLELDHSLSRGVVSNPKRKMEGKTLIQTDLAVNSGNSGGPLFNQKGELVGVIMGSFKGSSGIHFAVPASFVVAAMQAAKISPAAAATPAVKASGPPEKASPWSSRISQAMAESDGRKRLALLEKVAADFPEAADAHLLLGMEYYKNNQLPAARQRFEAAVKLKPEQTMAVSNLGLVLYRLGEYKQAEERLVTAISQDPNLAVAYLNLGMVYKDGLNNVNAAKRAFQRYLELDPNSSKSEELKQWLKQHNP